jgi:hypothetical protein
MEAAPDLATSFALLFLARGRAAVLVNKLYHPPANDWNNDPDDVRNLVEAVSRDWKSPLTWQVVDPSSASVDDLLRAPILFLNGHRAPETSTEARRNIRAYIDRGGSLFVDACCGAREFDQGFRRLMRDIFPEEPHQLRPLPPGNPVWHAPHDLAPEAHPLWGIERDGRIAVIYSPKDLSCYWNQLEHSPKNPAVDHAVKVGQNVIDYLTGRKPPPDKLSFPLETPFEAIAGEWRIEYSNGSARGYKIDNTGGVSYAGENMKGRIARRDGTLMLQFQGDDRLERLTLGADGRLFVEHWNPASDYPAKGPNCTGVGVKSK